MLKLQRHHKILVTFITLFVVAWAVWTLIILPRSETPNLPGVPNPPAPSNAPVNPD